MIMRKYVNNNFCTGKKTFNYTALGKNDSGQLHSFEWESDFDSDITASLAETALKTRMWRDGFSPTHLYRQGWTADTLLAIKYGRWAKFDPKDADPNSLPVYRPVD